MIVEKIALNGFRNYEWETVDFASEAGLIWRGGWSRRIWSFTSSYENR